VRFVIFVSKIGKMARPEHEPMDYLSKRGRLLFYRIIRHIKESDLVRDIDTLELSMLANSFDLYEKMAEECNEKGYVRPVSGKNGTFDQAVPQYTIMQQQYANIMKHSPKFGLTPGDREKIFSGMKAKKKKDALADLD